MFHVVPTPADLISDEEAEAMVKNTLKTARGYNPINQNEILKLEDHPGNAGKRAALEKLMDQCDGEIVIIDPEKEASVNILDIMPEGYTPVPEEERIKKANEIFRMCDLEPLR